MLALAAAIHAVQDALNRRGQGGRLLRQEPLDRRAERPQAVVAMGSRGRLARRRQPRCLAVNGGQPSPRHEPEASPQVLRHPVRGLTTQDPRRFLHCGDLPAWQALAAAYRCREALNARARGWDFCHPETGSQNAASMSTPRTKKFRSGFHSR